LMIIDPLRLDQRHYDHGVVGPERDQGQREY
jgi:hypothetical protein